MLMDQKVCWINRKDFSHAHISQGGFRAAVRGTQTWTVVFLFHSSSRLSWHLLNQKGGSGSQLPHSFKWKADPSVSCVCVEVGVGDS